MTFKSINPATATLIEEFTPFDSNKIEAQLESTANAMPMWSSIPLNNKGKLFKQLATLLRQQKEQIARTVSTEMGKLKHEALAEIEKCAWACDFYAEQGDEFLAPSPVKTDAQRSWVSYQPLGVVLGIMPWNFPFWQIFRFAVAALMAGNVVLVKHASNVSRCALTINSLFREAGFPENVFSVLLTSSQQIHKMINDPRVHAVTFTGSSDAGKQIAATAGACLKKSVLELGGSDAFVVLTDVDIEHVASQALIARFMNAGQSCIAAKRIIVIKNIVDEFTEALKSKIEKLQTGDPLDANTTLAPMARNDLRETLHGLTQKSIDMGASAITGCSKQNADGFFYAPSLIANVTPDMPAFTEELFGPVASIITANDEQHAIELANHTRYGLGGSIWANDTEKAEQLLQQLNVGMGFINQVVKSDPRMPCGGIKESGYGRELSEYGIHEFTNIRSNWIG